MKYKITPFNIVFLILIILGAWFGIQVGLGFLVPIFLLPLGFFGLLLDLLIQRLFKQKYLFTFITESIILIIIALCFRYTQRTNTLIIPDKITSNYFVIIYGVDSAPKLQINSWTLHSEIKIPDNGILLTSTSIEDSWVETKMKTNSGQELNTKQTKLQFDCIGTGELNCLNHIYKFRT